MSPNEPPSVSVSHRRSARPGVHPLGTLVWVRGDHDIATREHLSLTLAQAARVDDADIVADLSGVTFMDASTIGALVLARNGLRARSRALSLRAPSPRARRLLDLCGLERLIDEHLAPARPPARRGGGVHDRAALSGVR
jgi:anti-sigma B factor antagonist